MVAERTDNVVMFLESPDKGARSPESGFFALFRGKKMRNKKGLTLAEMIITVVILGIVAAMAIPGFRKTVIKAQNEDARTSLRMVLAGQKVYRMRYGSYYNSDIIADINDNLQLELFEIDWDFETFDGGGPLELGQVTSLIDPPGTERMMRVFDDGTIDCPAGNCNF